MSESTRTRNRIKNDDRTSARDLTQIQCEAEEMEVDYATQLLQETHTQKII